MKVINMNTAQIEKLIILVSKHPQLYDSNHVEYADQFKRDLIWETIGKELKLTAELCRAKWTILRSGYRKTLRNNHSFSRKKWRFEDNMQFLKGCIQRRINPQSLEPTQNVGGNMSDDDDNIGLDIKVEPEEPKLEDDDRTSSCDSVPIGDALKHLGSSSERNGERAPDKDAVTQFFMSMAETVKTLPLLVQAQIKAEVFRCVSSAEIQYLQDLK